MTPLKDYWCKHGHGWVPCPHCADDTVTGQTRLKAAYSTEARKQLFKACVRAGKRLGYLEAMRRLQDAEGHIDAWAYLEQGLPQGGPEPESEVLKALQEVESE